MANAWLLKPLTISAVNSPTSTALGALANLANDYAGVIWRSATGSAATIEFDMGSNVTIDTIMLLGISGPPTGAQMKIQAATSAQGNAFSGGVGTGLNQYWESTTGNLYAGTIVPASGKRKALWSAPSVSGPPASRYWRIVASSLSTNYLQAARAVLGARYTPQRNFVFNGAFGVRDFGKSDFSNRAVLLRRRAKKLRTLALTFSNAYRDEVEATVSELLETLGVTDPIGIVTDPSSNAQLENRMFFGLLTGDLGMIWRTAIAWEWRAQIVDLI